MAQKQSQGDVIRSFTLGNKELEGKTAEFQYDRGQYCIMDIVGEEKNIVYKSRNAQEAYTRWNVYIGRKKERPERAESHDHLQENNALEERPHRRDSANKEMAREESRPEKERNRPSRANDGDNHRSNNRDKKEERKNSDSRRNDRSNRNRGKRKSHAAKSQKNA